MFRVCVRGIGDTYGLNPTPLAVAPGQDTIMGADESVRSEEAVDAFKDGSKFDALKEDLEKALGHGLGVPGFGMGNIV